MLIYMGLPLAGAAYYRMLPSVRKLLETSNLVEIFSLNLHFGVEKSPYILHFRTEKSKVKFKWAN